MANHLTPSELADQLRMDQQEVIGRCVQMGIPIFHGRIDRTLFETSLRSIAIAGNPTSLRTDTPH
jgi:predicted nuclease with TOPRIM domain